MPQVIKYSLSIKNAKNFYSGVVDSVDNLYAFIGDKTAGAGWTDDAAPDTPIDSITEEENFWTNKQGAILLGVNDVTLVVPRKNWTAGDLYVVFDDSVDTAYSSDFYVLNSVNEVFVCTTSVSPTVAANEPDYASSVSGVYTGADGYVWEYVYTLTATELTLINDDWLPVTFDAVQKGTGTNNLDESADIMGAKYVYMQSEMDGATFLPNDVTYRQVSFILNPLLVDGVTVASGVSYDFITTPAVLTATSSGDSMYIENKTPITRAVDQTETVKSVVEF